MVTIYQKEKEKEEHLRNKQKETKMSHIYLINLTSWGPDSHVKYPKSHKEGDS